jgi:hypothetical protein
LIEQFKVELMFQRIDSVHLETNMRKAGRLSLMSSTIEMFLKACQNKVPEAFETLGPKVVEAYLPDKE